MGQIFITGFPYAIEIEGDKPTKAEAQQILKIVERLDEVKAAGENDLLNLADSFADQGSEIGSSLIEGAVGAEQKSNALKILEDLNMVDTKELKPLEKLGISRTDAGVAGSLLMSAPGYQNFAQLYKDFKSKKKLPTPKNIVLAGGKAWFGGIFGDISGRAAYDIANYIMSGGDKEMLQFLSSLDQDTKEAMWYESFGLLFPQLISAGYRALTNIKDPAVRAAYDAAERLGIQINFGQIAKYADKVKALGPLPFIGGTIRKTIESQGKILSDQYQKFKELFTPLTLFTDAGINIFNRSSKRFEAGKRIYNNLWQKAYDAHAMLPNKNVFKGNAINDFVKKLVNGDVLRQFKNLPVNEEGIIKEYDTIVKSGFFDQGALSRIKGDKLKDLITTIRNYQINLKNQGGNVSYEQIRNYNDSISGLFRDLTEGADTVFGDSFARLLTQLRGANDSILLNMDKTLIKDLIPKDKLALILSSHTNALNYSKSFKSLYESPTASIFGKYVDNLFEPGLLKNKKDVDMLLESLMKIKSPQGLRDLRQIIGPKEFKTFADEYLTNIFNNSIVKGGTDNLFTTTKPISGIDFDPAKLNKLLGFDVRGKSEFLDELFKIVGIGNSRLQDIIRTGAFLEGVKIGDPSSFLQRRFQLGGAKNVFATLLGAGAAYQGGDMVFNEDDGIFTKGFKGLIGLFAMRYGLGKVFANPKLANKIVDVFDPRRQIGWKGKVSLIRSLFDLHHAEQPDEISNTVSMFSDVKNDLQGIISEENMEDINDLLNELKINESIFNKGKELEEEEIKMEKLREENIEESSINVPVPNENIEMASVVNPIPNPIPSGPVGMDPEVTAKLESVGLPLFAKHGGIASLIGNKKPQPMVA